MRRDGEEDAQKMTLLGVAGGHAHKPATPRQTHND
jgi:hypothetical protein